MLRQIASHPQSNYKRFPFDYLIRIITSSHISVSGEFGFRMLRLIRANGVLLRLAADTLQQCTGSVREP